MNKEKYNGWTNYETWRVKLEMFDDVSDENYKGYTEANELAEVLEQTADDIITSFGDIDEQSIAVSYARAFLQEVNFYEIAESIINEMNN